MTIYLKTLYWFTFLEEIKNTSDLIKKNYGSSPIQYFVNSSAFLKPEKSLSQIDKDIVLQHFNVNIIGAMLVAKHFTPLLANPKVSGNPVVWSNLSAKTGSISDNGLGGWHSYRISKAALNQLTKTMSVELGRKGIQVLSLHPGTGTLSVSLALTNTVDTDLSRLYVKNVQHEIFSPEKAAELLFGVMTKTKENGVFLDYAGKSIPW